MTHKVGGAPFFARCNARYTNFNNKARIDFVGSPSQYTSFCEFTLSVYKYKIYTRGGTNWLLPNFCRSSFRPSVSTKIPRMGRT